MEQADGYIYHEQLEPDNHPCYFHELASRAAAHGLQYVAEARPDPLVESISPTARQKLKEMARRDRISYEQYLDFLVHRTFRVLSIGSHDPGRTFGR